MKKPVPEDFGMTVEQFKWVKEHPQPWEFKRVVFIIAVSLLIGLAAYAYWGEYAVAGGIGWLAFIVVSIVSSILCDKLVVRYHPLYHKAKLYREADKNYRRTLEEHWVSLKGVRLEDKLRRLYNKCGYSVKSTPTSGDKGIDLILNKDGKNIIVQCKGHKQPVGPSVIRELYGTLIDYKRFYDADTAILACPVGFTKGAREFALGKPIQLISAPDIIKMAQSASNGHE